MVRLSEIMGSTPDRPSGFLLMILLGCQVGVTLSNGQPLEHIIRRRRLREEGYTNFQMARPEFIIGEKVVFKSHRELHRHIRDTRAELENLELHLHAENETLQLVLNIAQPAMSRNVTITVARDNKTTSMHGDDDSDCFLTGRLKNSDTSSVSLSLCNNMLGVIADQKHSYWVEHMAMNADEDYKVDDGVYSRLPKLLLAKRPVTSGHHCSVTKEEDSVQYHVEDSIRPNVDKLVAPETKPRHKRAAEVITIETVVVLDQAYVQRLDAVGITTDVSIAAAMKVKWNGAQLEWSRSSQLQNYDVRIEIRELVIWRNNPSWYSASTLLQSTLSSICTGANANGLFVNYDHIHLFTGTSGTDVSGKAYISGACESTLKCAVSTWTGAVEFTIAAHELGHNLGMQHDGDVGCSGDRGLMGGKVSGWSMCSARELNTYLQSATSTCLRSTDVTSTPSAISLVKAWPGMAYTDDELCEFHHGPNYKFRAYPVEAWGICTLTSCILMDATSPYYGISFKHPKPTDGKYCGVQSVCSSDTGYPCLTWAEAGIDASLFTVVTGGWSDWNSWSDCSRTCGTGARHRTRICNNPKPQNSAGCEGDEYSALPCSTDPCAGDTGYDVISLRANEVCDHWKRNDLYSQVDEDANDYLNTGSKYNNNGFGQCEVKCDHITGYTPPTNQRFGPMPDGTPCTPSSFSYYETNNFPQTSGRKGRCVRGYCLTFGCNDETFPAQLRDVCGVCDGDNSTCQHIEGVFTDQVAKKARDEIVTIPALASNIQVYFTYNDMKNAFMQLYTKEDRPVAGYFAQGNSVQSTTDNPINHAGAFWIYEVFGQYFLAFGPLTEAVVIKLYNFGGKTNPGIQYSYTLPLSSVVAACSGTCENGGTWNQELCTCDCAAGYYGTTCNTDCSNYCNNGVGYTSSCACDCQDNMYGSRCLCKYPYTGVNCQQCKFTSCQNGGTFNSATCRCTCPQGFGSLDCSTPCEDNVDTATCETNEAKGWCNSRNEQMEADCYLTCGLCEPASTTTAATTTAATTTAATTTTTATAGPGGGQTTTGTGGGQTTVVGETTTTGTSTVSTAGTTTEASTTTVAATTTTTVAPTTLKRHCRDVETPDNAADVIGSSYVSLILLTGIQLVTRWNRL